METMNNWAKFLILASSFIPLTLFSFFLLLYYFLLLLLLLLLFLLLIEFPTPSYYHSILLCCQQHVRQAFNIYYSFKIPKEKKISFEFSRARCSHIIKRTEVYLPFNKGTGVPINKGTEVPINKGTEVPIIKVQKYLYR